MKQADLYCDGGARGNPGPAGAGAVLLIDEQVVDKTGKYLGRATNNSAEYQGLLLGLELARGHQVQNLAIYLDSELIVKQILGTYKVKHAGLLPLWQAVKKELGRFNNWSIKHVPRSMNKLADQMVNQAIDHRL